MPRRRLLLALLRAAASAVSVYAAASPRGAPADVFAAKSPREPAALYRQGRRGRPRTFATQLVPIASGSNPARIRSVGDVAGVVSKVALGSADAGFVHVTDARIARGRVTAIRLPTFAQPPIRYYLCMVRRRGADARGARGFVRRVLSPRGRQLLRAGGFGVPGR